MKADVQRELWRRAHHIAAAPPVPSSGGRMTFSNYEAQRALAEAFGVRAPRSVVKDACGVYRVTDSEFATTDPVLARAVAQEYDRLDRVQYPTIGTE